MDPPSVLFLIGDCLRTANVSEETMPFTQDLADVSATSCYSPGTWTLSSHASLYNISSPIEHGVTQLNDKLQPSQAKLPKIAQEHGYTTSLFSENPTFGSFRGFSHCIDYCNSEIGYKLFPSTFSPTEVVSDDSFSAIPSVAREWARRPNRLRNSVNLAYGFAKFVRDADPHVYPHHGKRVVDHLTSFLNRTSGSDEQQLSFVNLLDPHNPHYAQPPPEGADPLGIEVRPEETEALAAVKSQDVLLSHQDPPEEVAREFPTWEAVYERQEEIYEGQIRYVDYLIESLESTIPSWFDDALVVITGDHGHLFYEEETVEHHSSLHPGGIHVPLYLSLPASWERSERVVNEPITLVDVARSVAEVVRGTISDTEAFIDELTSSDEVLVAADGPMWDVNELREKYDDELVDTLAARRVGVFDGDQMIEYECPWRHDYITKTEYRYQDDTRLVISDPVRVDSIESTQIEQWLRNNESTEGAPAATRRLKQLGYLK